MLLKVWDVGKQPAAAAIFTVRAVSFSFTTDTKLGKTHIAATFGIFVYLPEKLLTFPVK
jgi:hypothetical protein